MNSDIKSEQRFEFGKNWLDYIQQNYGEEVVQTSMNHILSFMGVENLNGNTFLDIGCGSGLHSVAALQAGAQSVHSFDYDPNSVAATQFVKQQAAMDRDWKIEQGSVLDSEYMMKLPKFDIVYSWGVLHHTGAVWEALKNASETVKDGGRFYIALYAADVQIDPTPEFWLDIKRRYVSANWFVRRYFDAWYIWRFMMNKNLKNLPVVFARMRSHKKNRGMSMMTDIRDWLGGWPMEFVYDDEVIKYCERLGFELKNIKTGEACSEYLFSKIG